MRRELLKKMCGRMKNNNNEILRNSFWRFDRGQLRLSRASGMTKATNVLVICQKLLSRKFGILEFCKFSQNYSLSAIITCLVDVSYIILFFQKCVFFFFLLHVKTLLMASCCVACKVFIQSCIF